jgi:hypothetical protein
MSTTFKHIAEELTMFVKNNASYTKPARKITKKEFEEFKQHYIFDQLCDTSFGYAFSKRFDISDYFLKFVASTDIAIEHIHRMGYVK